MKKKILPEFGKAGKMGTYTIIISAIVLAVLVVVNLIVSALPSKYTKFDTSATKMYTLSDGTQDFVSGLTQDVTLYYVVVSGQEDEKIETFLARFSDLNPKVKVKNLDPVKEPDFLKKYNAEDLVSTGFLIVSDKRSKAISLSEFYYYANESGEQMSVDEYEYYSSYYGEYFEYYFGVFEPYFDGDSAITGAIEYVTAEKVPTVYILEGHNEKEFEDVITLNLFDYQQITYSKVNIALDEIPEDADVIIINTPSTDLAPEETDRLIAYFNNGGKIMLITAGGCEDYTNLCRLTAVAGMAPLSGTVNEGDSGYHNRQSLQLIYPTENTAHDALSVYGSVLIQYGTIRTLMPYPHAIALNGADGVTLSQLLTTTEKAYLGTDSSHTASYCIAAATEKGDGKFVWIPSSLFLTSTYLNATNGANFYFASSVLSWMHGDYSSKLPTIAGISMTEPVLSVDANDANLWGTILIVVVPLVILGGGLAYFIYRRRK